MGKKQPDTPRGRIRSTVRRLWLTSRERDAAIKRSGNKCECCGALSKTRKGGEATLEVHHRDGIEWEKVIDYIKRNVLQHPDRFDVLCTECHKTEHEEK